MGGGGGTPSEWRESPGPSLPRQRSPDGNVLLHCSLPPVPRKQSPLPLESGSERGTVSLIDHFTHFELHLCTHPKKAAQLWKLAHDAVFAGLKKAGKTIGYTNN
ncbi:hypothetical protein GBAR_LOCUS18875, partial [Geodia barretti]